VKIRWLDQAVMDLMEIRNFIVQDNPAAAREVSHNIRQAVAILADYPASDRPGRVPHTRELLIAGTPYILPYRVHSGMVEILRVLHSSRKWPAR
jgi:toxin ParE1/3/4